MYTAWMPLCFTHGHKDHTAGMDDVRPFNYFERKAIPLYVDELTEEALRKEYHYVFGTNTYPGIPQVSSASADRKNI